MRKIQQGLQQAQAAVQAAQEGLKAAQAAMSVHHGDTDMLADMLEAAVKEIRGGQRI